MRWNIAEEDIRAIKFILDEGPKTLTELVREVYGIGDEKDRVKKINRFKSHLKHMTNEGFLIKISDEEDNNPKIKYAIPEYAKNGLAKIDIITNEEFDITPLGRVLKYERGDLVEILSLDEGWMLYFL